MFAKTIYVDAGASGANDGTTWNNAYAYLQDALDAAQSGDEIWVAQGIYRPDQGGSVEKGDRTASFSLKNGVSLRAGYAGSAMSNPNARNVQTYVTELSGDLAANDRRKRVSGILHQTLAGQRTVTMSLRPMV